MKFVILSFAALVLAVSTFGKLKRTHNRSKHPTGYDNKCETTLFGDDECHTKYGKKLKCDRSKKLCKLTEDQECVISYKDEENCVSGTHCSINYKSGKPKRKQSFYGDHGKCKPNSVKYSFSRGVDAIVDGAANLLSKN